MAKGKKTGGKDFKPGVVTNPLGAGAHDQTLKKIRKLTTAEIEDAVSMILEKTPEQIKEMAEAKDQPAIKILIASVLYKGIKEGDSKRMEALFARCAGRLKMDVKVNAEVEVAHIDADRMKEIMSDPEAAKLHRQLALRLAKVAAPKDK